MTLPDNLYHRFFPMITQTVIRITSDGRLSSLKQENTDGAISGGAAQFNGESGTYTKNNLEIKMTKD